MLADHAEQAPSMPQKDYNDPAAWTFQTDCSARESRLSDEKTRLFSADDHRLEVICVSGAESERPGTRVQWILRDVEQLLAKLNDPTCRSASGRIFYVTQSYTWSTLQISEEMFRQLRSSLGVNPRFLDIVQLFGEKAGPVEESHTSFFGHLSPHRSPQSLDIASQRCSFELGYSVKHVERHGRPFPSDPFSIRETGVYHKWDANVGNNTWIFIQPSKATKADIDKLSSQLPEAFQFQIHIAVLLGASEDWRYYTNYLEDSFSKLIDRSFFTKVKGPTTQGGIDVDFNDIRKLQILTDKLCRIAHILSLNINAGHQIQRLVQQLRNAWQPLDTPMTWALNDFEAKAGESIFCNQTHKARVDSMLRRSEGISSLVYPLLSETCDGF
ncbi:MAG: hypothetical protein M1833_003236 [Piccolia ochrophora]|nr:MAG: hypothetical protein M1833_003236 [Piccolia ochrophora]